MGTALLPGAATGPATPSRTRTATEIPATARIVTPMKVVPAIPRAAAMRRRSMPVRRSLRMFTSSHSAQQPWCSQAVGG